METDAEQVVIGAPGFVAQRRRRVNQLVPVRTESEVIANRKGGGGWIGIAVARGDIFRLAALAVVERHDEQMLPLVADVFVPMAIEKPGEDLGLDRVLLGL